MQTARSNLREAKDAYSAAIAQRSASQREVNELLQRKHAWSPQDLERFTSLYRSDHANEQAETSAQDALQAAEQAAEGASAKLGASILARYHEEQIWSDKIRRMSTWGTWGLMGVNVLLFLVFQIGVEPWKRKRLVKGFEEKVMEALERESAAHGGAIEVAPASPSGQGNAAQEAVSAGEVEGPELEAVSTTVNVTEETEFETGKFEAQSTPRDLGETPREGWNATRDAYREKVNDLFSERLITVRRVDVTAAALEGAFAGVTLVSILVAIMRSR